MSSVMKRADSCEGFLQKHFEFNHRVAGILVGGQVGCGHSSHFNLCPGGWRNQCTLILYPLPV